jgi:hypothetical protein
MATIQVQTPTGIQQVVIAGDTPTPEEEAAIRETFFSDAEVTEEEVSVTEEVPAATEIPATEIDYKTGVKSDALRFAFGSGNNDRERRLQLLRKGIPEEGFFQDAEGRFILDLEHIPEDVQQQYGLKEVQGRTKLAVDESGFSWEDIVDLTGEARGPLIAGTAAALATTGVGIPLAALLVGGASAMGYVADEAIEYSQGVRDQTLGEDAKNLFFEFAAGGTGEIGGRLLNRLFGRLIKGPGNPEANVTRTTAREILAGETDPVTGKTVTGRPTLRATNTAPLLGRAQAFFEGVFPNARVATRNAEYLQVSYLNLLRQMDIPEEQAQRTSTEFLSSLKRDIERLYSSPEELAKQANARLKNTVDREISSLIARFGDTSYEGGEFALRAIKVNKARFDEDVDMLYAKASELFGDKDIIGTQPLKNALAQIVKKHIATGPEIEKSALGKVINGLNDNVSVDTMNMVRTALREASYDPSLIGSQDRMLLTQLLKKVDDSIDEAHVSFLDTNRPEVWASGQMQDPVGKRLLSKDETAAVLARWDMQKAGFEALRNAQDFYKKGIGRFDTFLAKKMTLESKGGELVDPDAILETIIQPNRGKLLKDLLDATRPTPRKGLGGKEGFPIQPGPRSYLDLVPDINVKIDPIDVKIDPSAAVGKPKRAPGAKPTVINLRETVAANPDDPLARFFKRRFDQQRSFANEVAEARKAGTNYRTAVRQSLARRWMERAINDPSTTNIFGRTDPLKLSAQIRELGSTGKVLFGKDYDAVMRSVADISLVGDEIGEAELRSLAGRPITEQIEAVRQMTGTVEDLKGLPFLRNLETAARSGEMDKVVNLVTRNKDTIRQARELFGADSSVMNDVKDTLLARILGSIGDPSSEITARGKRTLSPEFVKEVMSGRKHDQIMKSIDSLGRDKMEDLFGTEVIKGIELLAKKAEAVSMRPLAGLGGLETANIARSLTMGAMFIKPIGVLSTVLGLKTAATVLRSKFFLNTMARPTGDLANAGNLERALGLAWAGAGRTGIQATALQIEEEQKRASAFKKRVATGVGPVITERTQVRPPTSMPVPGAPAPGAPPVGRYAIPEYNAGDIMRQVEQEKLLGLRQ